jgi:hypothetical protein
MRQSAGSNGRTVWRASSHVSLESDERMTGADVLIPLIALGGGAAAGFFVERVR